MGRQQGLSQGLLKGSMVDEPGQGRSQTQGHCHWGQGHCQWGPLGGYQSQVHQEGSKVGGPYQGRSQVQGHCHWGHLEGHCHRGQLGGYQGQVLQVQQGQVVLDGC